MNRITIADLNISGKAPLVIDEFAMCTMGHKHRKIRSKKLITYAKDVRCTTIRERFDNLKHLFAISWREKHGSGILARVY